MTSRLREPLSIRHFFNIAQSPCSNFPQSWNFLSGNPENWKYPRIIAGSFGVPGIWNAQNTPSVLNSEGVFFTLKLSHAFPISHKTMIC